MSETIRTRSGRTIILPTPEEDAAITAVALSDPDAIPLTDGEWESVKPSLTRGFKETVKSRLERDPEFRKALRRMLKARRAAGRIIPLKA